MRRQMKALKTLLEYNLEDEVEGFFDNPPDLGRESGHILASIGILLDEFFPARGKALRWTLQMRAALKLGAPYYEAATRLIAYWDRVKSRRKVKRK